MDDIRRGWCAELRFTITEFETMVNELLYCEPISFDMLCEIAEKTLKPTVAYWCNSEKCLQGRNFEDDIMQEINLRLMKTTVGYFLLRDNIEGPFNNNPEGFEDWMFKIASNIKRDFANKVRNYDFNTVDIEGNRELGVPFDEYDVDEKVDRLKESFKIVLSSNVGIYKVLTWLAQSVFIIGYNVTKIKSNDMIINAFENKTLYEMYDMILYASKSIPWIVINEQQNQKILSALGRKRHGDISFGETKYCEFFMKHNGEISGKKSISDWMNRMNKIIRRTIESNDDISDKTTKKSTSAEPEDEKRRGGDATSDC